MSGQAPDIQPPVAANLCRFQAAAGMSNLDLAEALGHRDDRQITRWRSGRVTPSWTNVIALAGVLDVAPADFYVEPELAA